MIHFKSLMVKNVGSFGNKPTKFEYKSGVDVVSGVNGAGKSGFFISSLYYSLFGKSHTRLNLTNLVNKINGKNLFVELEFDVNGLSYKIERGMKPNVFNIYREDKLIPHSASARDYQHLLEYNILGFGETTFKSTVAICSTNYVPFLQLTALERRYVLDDILGLSVFTRMNDVLKQENSNVEDELYAVKKQAEKLKVDIKIKNEVGKNRKELIEQNILSVRKEIAEIIKEHVPPLVKKYKELDEKINKIDISEYNKQLSEYQSMYDDISDKISDIKYKIKQIKQEEKFFQSGHTKCSQCQQEISKEYAEKQIEDLKGKSSGYESEVESFEEKYKEITDNISELKNIIKSHKSDTSELDELKNRIKFFKKEIEKKETNIKKQEESLNQESNVLQEDIDLLMKNLEETYDMIKETQSIIDCNSHIFAMFKDDGIKLYVIKTIIPTFNTIIKDLEDTIESEFHLEFDENFNEKIYNPNNEIVEFNSMSTGERSIASLLLIFAFRELAKMRSGLNTNLLILDEMIEGILSNDNVYHFTKLLQSMKNYNVQIISHMPEYYDEIVTRHVTVEKKDSFSEFRIDG